MSNLAVIILAAGKGTRMKSTEPKVLHPLAGRPMILHVMDALAPLEMTKTIVITGHEAKKVEDAIHASYPQAECIRQIEQLGTGHAVLQAEKALQSFRGTVLIIYGDVLLCMLEDALDYLIDTHLDQKNVLTLLSAIVDDPTGLGRIDREDNIIRNVEEKDCTDDQIQLDEVNTGYTAVAAEHLFSLLKKTANTNKQKEYYLPDILHLAQEEGLAADVVPVASPRCLLGINNRAELAEMEGLLQNVYRTQHMLNGATLQDPETTYFSWDTKLGQDVTIEPNVVFGPGVTVANGSTIRAHSHLEGATLAEGCTVGPFARLRPGATVQKGAKVGNFVEIKNSTIGDNSKVSHLSYLGDTTLGANVNVGGGTVVANYHHPKRTKNQTTVEDGVSLGANSTLVAPVTIGSKACVGAGTVVRKNVPDHALVVDRAEQVIKEDYTT
jgi:bifunctional UDP-N-acetylglucosamine pyrophosphorylase/glucosamine-1-phosphate N-acetyltransferase